MFSELPDRLRHIAGKPVKMAKPASHRKIQGKAGISLFFFRLESCQNRTNIDTITICLLAFSRVETD